MFHAWPVKIISTAASSRPTLLRGNAATSASTRPGMKPSTGMLCRTSSSGTRMRSAIAILGGPVAVDQREGEREHVGHEPAREREERVTGQRQRREVDVDLRAEVARPLDADLAQAVQQPREADRDGEVDQRRSAALRALLVRPAPDVRERGEHWLGHGGGRVARRVEQSKIAHRPSDSKGGISPLRSDRPRALHNHRTGIAPELARMLLSQNIEAPATDAPPPSTWRFFFSIPRDDRVTPVTAPARGGA